MTARRNPKPDPDEMSADQQRLYAAYCTAARQAQFTLCRSDAHAAGQAWAAFLGAYAPVPEVVLGVMPQPIGGKWA